MTPTLNWERNDKFSALPQPMIADWVTLKSQNAWGYDVRLSVQEVTDQSILGTVIDIFDRSTGMIITGGEVTRLLGTNVSFILQNIFAVLERK